MSGSAKKKLNYNNDSTYPKILLGVLKIIKYKGFRIVFGTW